MSKYKPTASPSDGKAGRSVVIGLMVIWVRGAPLAVKPVTPAGIFTVTSPLAEDALALDVKFPVEFTSRLKSVVPGGSVVVVTWVVVVVVELDMLVTVTVITGGVVCVVVSKAMFTIML
jgi:hypothetical protein